MATVDEWRYCRFDEVRLYKEQQRFRSVPSAEAWLRRIRFDASSARRALALRRVSVWRLADDEVLRLFAARLVRGEFVICRHPKEFIALAAASAPHEMGPAFPLSQRQASAPERQRESETQSFSDDANLAAISDAQGQAAEQGLPFCEECARLSQDATWE